MSRLGLMLLSLAVSLAAAPAEVAAQAGPCQVGTFEQTWHDASRDRDVPVRIYYPSGPGAPATSAVIVFSHGLGGSRGGYAYLGKCWASHGYISVHVQHLGSDSAILRGLRPRRSLQKAIADPTNSINRPLDIRFVIDRLTVLNADPGFPLHYHFDLARLGVAGHSFGAFTTMAVAGVRLPVLSGDPKYRDPRIKAAIAMSTPASSGDQSSAPFDAVRIPVFHMTGTKDGSTGVLRDGDATGDIGNTPASARRRPFDRMQHATAYLLTFTGGDHMVFSGRLATPREHDTEFQAMVCAGSVAFWDAYLRDDAAAQKWLEAGGFAAALGPLGTFEQKHPR
jgi:predicted dienelactone hydrolase